MYTEKEKRAIARLTASLNKKGIMSHERLISEAIGKHRAKRYGTLPTIVTVAEELQAMGHSYITTGEIKTVMNRIEKRFKENKGQRNSAWKRGQLTDRLGLTGTTALDARYLAKG